MSEAIERTQTEPTELYQKKLQELLEKGKATKKLPSRLLIETLDLLDAAVIALVQKAGEVQKRLGVVPGVGHDHKIPAVEHIVGGNKRQRLLNRLGWLRFGLVGGIGGVNGLFRHGGIGRLGGISWRFRVGGLRWGQLGRRRFGRLGLRGWGFGWI